MNPTARTGLRRLGLLLTIAAAARAVPAADPPKTSAGPQAPGYAEQLGARVGRCDAALKADPRNVGAMQARAEALFHLGRIQESVRDFDRVVALAPETIPRNWQRGIALYYAGRFDDGAKQFERCREVNPQDVENAAFHFVCVARAAGPERGPGEAVKRLIPVDGDRRVPMAKIHAMYALRAAPADVIAEANHGHPNVDERLDRLFYAQLYIALWHDGCGRPAEAAKHIRLAAGEHRVDGYMGDVARVHAWLAATDRLPSSPPVTRPSGQ